MLPTLEGAGNGAGYFRLPRSKLMFPADGEKKSSEVPLPGFRSGLIRIIEHKTVGERFSYSKQFFQPRTIALVHNRKVQKLDCAIESPVTVIQPALSFPGNRSFYLAPNICHLLRETKLIPSSRGQFSVLIAHRLTKSATIFLMISLTSGLSTLLLLFPCDGRRLIIESNSIKSEPSNSG